MEGDVGCLGCQKAYHRPLVMGQDSLLFTIHLGAVDSGRQQLTGTECQRKGWVVNIHVYQKNRQSCQVSIPEMPCIGISSLGLSLLLHHLCLSDDMNG